MVFNNTVDDADYLELNTEIQLWKKICDSYPEVLTGDFLTKHNKLVKAVAAQRIYDNVNVTETDKEIAISLGIVRKTNPEKEKKMQAEKVRDDLSQKKSEKEKSDEIDLESEAELALSQQ